MFIAEETCLAVGLSMAQARLEHLARGGSLTCVSRAAYGGAPGLVSVAFVDLVVRGDSVILGVRWNTAGRGDALFPALDANIILTADGERATVLRLEGTYRAGQGGADPVIADRVATATIRSFVGGLADAITCGTGAGQPPG